MNYKYEAEAMGQNVASATYPFLLLDAVVHID